MLTDLRQAFHRLLRTPGFTLITMLTLALGLGANISVFGMLSEFLLRPLKVPQPEQLVFLMQKSPKFELPYSISYPDYRDLRSGLAGAPAGTGGDGAVFSDLVAYAMLPVHLGESGKMAERVWVHAVSGNFFDVLDVPSAQGRLFLPGEGESPGSDPVAVLGYQYWIERFQGDPRVIGSSFNINGEPFTIVGVARKDFGGAEAMIRAQIFVPLTMWGVLQPGNKGALEARGSSAFMVMGRMNPGVTVAQAQAAVAGQFARLVADHPNEHAATEAVLIPEIMGRPSPFVSRFAPAALVALMLLGTLVLIVAMANVANLLYARFAEAGRSLAIRSSLGATRWQLIRHQLAESLLLSIGAGVLGWYIAEGFGVFLQSISISADNPPPAEGTTDWRPLVFSGTAALMTGLATGLFPALRATRREVLPQLNEGTRSVVATRHPLRSVLVAGQVALSCFVLVCAGMAVNSLQVLSHADLGFRPENVLLATFDLELQRYDEEQARQFQKTLLDEVRALPGAKSASFSRAVPFDRGVGLWGGIGAEGQPMPEREDMYLIAVVSATPGFLETMGVSLLAGRDFTEQDDAKAPEVAVINESVARHFWPGEDPLGRRLTFDGGTRLVEVVGVVETGRFFMLSDRDRPMVIRPLAQQRSSTVTLAIHTAIDPLQLAKPVQQAVQRLDPNLPIFNMRTLEEHVVQSPLGLMPLRLGALVAAIQGALVLVLAVMGLYGLVSFAVACRTREIGIRMALGASRGEILRLVSRPSLVLTGVGLGIGLALALLLSRPLSGLLYGAAPNLPLVFIVVAVLIGVVTLAAAWLPARRAARIDPVDALRAE